MKKILITILMFYFASNISANDLSERCFKHAEFVIAYAIRLHESGYTETEIIEMYKGVK